MESSAAAAPAGSKEGVKIQGSVMTEVSREPVKIQGLSQDAYDWVKKQAANTALKLPRAPGTESLNFTVHGDDNAKAVGCD